MPAAVTPLKDDSAVSALVRAGSGAGAGAGLAAGLGSTLTGSTGFSSGFSTGFSSDLALAFFKISDADGMESTGANLARALDSLPWVSRSIKFFNEPNSSLISFNSSLRLSLVKLKFFSILFFKLSISSFMSRKSSSNVNLSLLYLVKKSLTEEIVLSMSSSFSSFACLISFCSTAIWSKSLSILMNSSSIFCLSSSMVVCVGGTISGIKYFDTT